jgi:class 3 adenylate cyclase
MDKKENSKKGNINSIKKNSENLYEIIRKNENTIKNLNSVNDFSKLIDSISSYEKYEKLLKSNYDSNINWLNDSSFDRQLSLEEEITDLRKKLKQTLNELNEVSSDKNQKIKELTKLKEELQAKEKINHILPRICEEARRQLLTDDNFRKLFEDGTSCNAIVMSIDIRRSTELMLKARRPELFSKFITELSQKLSEVILSNYGVFDKFTGDGVLAFFPQFYSGEFAIIRALKTANECHRVFEKHYKLSRDCFNVFIKDIGLGIGIDYGTVTLVNSGNELTVVGIPVVYACRMSGAKAGDTLLNQPAKEEVERLCKNYIKITETEIVIKNEGTALAYKIELHDNSYSIDKPKWIEMNE